MSELPEHVFLNPVWNALRTKQCRLALCSGESCRYPANVAPFAAVNVASTSALEQLRSLLEPGEMVWIVGASYPQVVGLAFEEKLECVQMVLPQEVTLPDRTVDVVALSAADAREMVALTDLAFPGFFRIRTCEMGSYYGVRREGALIAMGGERLRLDGYTEISGLCTHPDHRGKGLAASLIWELVRKHRRDGVVSWLNVGEANRHAIELYLRMGFQVVRHVTLNKLLRPL